MSFVHEELTKIMGEIPAVITEAIAILTALLAVGNYFWNNRWRRILKAKELVDEFLDDAEAEHALLLLDGRTIWFRDKSVSMADKIANGGKYPKVAIRSEDVNIAFQNWESVDEKSIHIRDCFDSMFHYFAILEYYIETRLVKFKDVKFPADYYVKKIDGSDKMDKIDDSLIRGYCAKLKLDRAEKFMQRFSKK
jgi:hypothetical protein